ncbi:MAG: DUF6588 family protein [Leeuwenhoekiella sp.]
MKKYLLIMSFLCISSAVRAQIYGGSFESVLAAGKNDANVLMGAYVQPAMEGLVYAMNGGWYHTAETHSKLGFDFTVAFNASMVASEKEMFSISGLKFENTITGVPDNTPTVAGGFDPSEVTVIINETNEQVQFTMPEGIKDDLPLNAIPAPTLQASLGLIFDTDVIVRYTPKVGSNNVKGSIVGAGLKHNLMQYFGPLDKLPLHISVLGAFTKMNIDYDIEDGNVFEGANQRAEFELNSYTVQAIASLDFPIISVYGALGYSGGKSNLKVLGTYKVSYADVAGIPVREETFEDPIDLVYTPSGARATLGARLNLSYFKIFADYTVQDYNNITAGIAFSFR